MANHNADFPVGTRVSFRAGPGAKQDTQAEVTGYADGGWLLTKEDGTGKIRKTRAGNCRKI